MIKRFMTFLVIAIGATAALGGCDRSGNESQTALRNSNGNSAIPSAMFEGKVPQGARSVSAVKGDKSAKGEVIVRGRIGGRAKPFVDGAAVFLLTDSSLKSCDQLHGDACKTPWDYCCETPESLVANVATIQIVDDAGKPIRAGLNGVHGLKPLAEVVVTGDIVGRVDDGVLVVNARRIVVVRD